MSLRAAARSIGVSLHLRPARHVCWTTRRSSSTWLNDAAEVDVDVVVRKDRKTKIVATVGPATLPRLEDVLLAGADILRINCAHGDNTQYSQIVASAREASLSIRRLGKLPTDVRRLDSDSVAIAFDIKGPEIRVGRFNPSLVPTRELLIRKGDVFTFTADPAAVDQGSPSVMFMNYPPLARDVGIGQRILIDDGNLEFVVSSVDAASNTVRGVAMNGGLLLERKGVNLPGLHIDLPHVTPKDLRDIETARSLGADFLFASFVQSAGMVDAIRAASGPAIRIIAKIENEAGLSNYDDILRAADGIMVARGDLGVQLPLERVFLAQKRMIARANLAGKPVICATQMLESMIVHNRPTRAECTDVAVAVEQGADAVMLSAETAKGAWPVEAVATMSRIACVAEAATNHFSLFMGLSEAQKRRGSGAAAASSPFGSPAATPTQQRLEALAMSDHEALAAAATHASFDVNAGLILVVSRTGRTAGLLAKYRPAAPIICITYDEVVCRRVQLLRGVQAVLFPPPQAVPAGTVTGGAAPNGASPAAAAVTVQDVIQYGVSLAKARGLTSVGDACVVVCGQGVGAPESGADVISTHSTMHVSLLHVK